MSFKEAYLLSFFHSQRTTTAPQTEVMSSPSQLKAGPMPSKPKRVPPTKPPMRPKSRSIKQPLPLPFVILLAMKPARIPVIIPITILLKILSVVLYFIPYNLITSETYNLRIPALSANAPVGGCAGHFCERRVWADTCCRESDAVRHPDMCLCL